jgi:hypothetical protein
MAKPGEDDSSAGVPPWVIAAAGVVVIGLGWWLMKSEKEKPSTQPPTPVPVPKTDDKDLPVELPTNHIRPKGLQKGQPIIFTGESILVVGDETVSSIVPELQKRLQNPIDFYAKPGPIGHKQPPEGCGPGEVASADSEGNKTCSSEVGATYTELYTNLKDRADMLPNSYDVIIVMSGYSTALLPDPSTDLPGLQQLTGLLRKTAWRDVILMSPLGPLHVPDGQAKFEKVQMMLKSQLLGLSDLFAVLLKTSLSPVMYWQAKVENPLIGDDDLDVTGVIPTPTGAIKIAEQLVAFLKAPQV